MLVEYLLKILFSSTILKKSLASSIGSKPVNFSRAKSGYATFFCHFYFWFFLVFVFFPAFIVIDSFFSNSMESLLNCILF